jgi:hypothetical protein
MATTTKLYILNEAFDEIGLADYIFNIQPNELMAALRKLDALVASWEAEGLSIGWVFSADPSNSDPNNPITVPDAALLPLATCTAIRLAPSYGKTISPETKIASITGMNALRTALANIPQQQLPNTLPIGAGNPWPYNHFFQEETQVNINGNTLIV